jgi:hypothetical protein
VEGDQVFLVSPKATSHEIYNGRFALAVRIEIDPETSMTHTRNAGSMSRISIDSLRKRIPSQSSKEPMILSWPLYWKNGLFGTRKMDYTWVGVYRNLENGFQRPS